MSQADLGAAAAPVTDDKMWRVSRPELERRWGLVRDRLVARNIDALIVQGYEDKIGGYVKWLTDTPAGYPRTVIFHASDLMTVVEHGANGARRELDGSALDHPGVGEIVTNWAFHSAHYCGDLNASDVAAVIKRRGYKRIAMANAVGMPSGFVGGISSRLAGTVEIVDETDFIDTIKARKSAEEIVLIRKIADTQDAVFGQVLGHIKPGMRDFEINAFIDYQLQLRGAERGVYIAKSAPFGKSAPFAYRHFQGRRFGRGDYLNFLLESNGFGGYWTELGRAICFGKAPSELKDGFELCREAQSDNARRCREGALASDIFRAHNNFMTARGAPPERRLHAHSQGQDMVERPLIREDETLTIERGCNLAIHPVLATSSLWISICDNYLVDLDGEGVFLHATPKQIFEL